MSQDTNITNLDGIIHAAEDIREHFHDLPEFQRGLVHFRPTINGVTLIGLLPERPQRGKGGYRAVKLRANFETEFRKHCVDITQGRPTPEKRLQSFMISDAYQHDRQMQVLQSQIPSQEDTALYFVTDEIALVNGKDKVVCDLLALNQRKNGYAPVLMELKSRRAMKRLVEQLDNYESIVKTYRPSFERLFSALLGQQVHFSHAVEKWLVWPALAPGPDRREAELSQQGIRVIGYTEDQAGGFQFQVGQRPDWD